MCTLLVLRKWREGTKCWRRKRGRTTQFNVWKRCCLVVHMRKPSSSTAGIWSQASSFFSSDIWQTPGIERCWYGKVHVMKILDTFLSSMLISSWHVKFGDLKEKKSVHIVSVHKKMIFVLLCYCVAHLPLPKWGLDNTQKIINFALFKPSSVTITLRCMLTIETYKINKSSQNKYMRPTSVVSAFPRFAPSKVR